MRVGKDLVSEDNETRAIIETYGACIFRLHVLDGARIPKYSYDLSAPIRIISEKITNINTITDITAEHDDYVDKIVNDLENKILASGKK